MFYVQFLQKHVSPRNEDAFVFYDVIRRIAGVEDCTVHVDEDELLNFVVSESVSQARVDETIDRPDAFRSG